VTLLSNRELVSRAKLCPVSVFPDIVKDCPKIRNLPKIFLNVSRMWPQMFKTKTLSSMTKSYKSKTPKPNYIAN